MVTFDVSNGPQSPMEESELSTSGVSGQSASDEVQKRDDYEGPQQLTPISSPARSVNRSPYRIRSLAPFIKITPWISSIVSVFSDQETI